MKEFDLNIEKVLENWTVAHAIREIIANALDEQILTGTDEIEVYHDKSERWHIRDYGRGIQYQHLTQNENQEKQNHPHLIGKFGVGLKDALATFDRNGIGVTMVASGRDVDQMENDTLTVPNNTKLGVSSEQFADIKRVLEISAIYGFDDDDAEFVYHMATEFSISIEEAAEFCEEAKIQDEFDLTDHESQQLLYEIRCNGYKHLYELPKGFFDVYFSEENDKHGWFVPYICEIAEALDENGMCADDLSDIVMHADTYGVDIVEAIENFEEYEKDWNDIVCDAMANGISEEDTGGFGYRSIWEFPEE